MIDLDKTIWYKGESICWDDLGFYTVFYAGDDIIFDTVEDAKDFIDEMVNGTDFLDEVI